MSSEGSSATAVSEIAEPARAAGVRHGRMGAGYWIGAWWPVVVAMALILCESTEYFGADRTSGPLRLLWQYLFGQVSDDLWEVVHVIIRKTGHFVGYGIVGLTWLRAWRMTLRDSRFLLQAGLALAGTAAIAICDEWHQNYLFNREGSPWDVLLDCCGALAMMLLVYIFLQISRPWRLAHES
jgi:VanZ family protein